MPRTYKTEGIILKRLSSGEADRIVTIFTKHYGKVVAIAKGVRKITSRRAASLEPATQAVFFFHRGKSLDLISQTKLVNSFSEARKNLKRLTQVHQILEIVDLLTRENQEHQQVYDILLSSLKSLNSPGNKRQLMVDKVREIVRVLGFGQPQDKSETTLKHFIEEISDRKLRSKEMLPSLVKS